SAEDFGALRFVGAALLILALAAFAGLVTGGTGRAVVHGGGWLGGFIGTVLRGFLGGLGAFLILTMMVAFAVVLSTGASAIDVTARSVRWLGLHGRELAERTWTMLRRRMRREPPSLAESRRARSLPAKPIPLVELDEDDVRAARPAKIELPPIIREPEKRPELPKRDKTKRIEEQEELFVEDTYRLPTLTLLDAPVRTMQPIDESALHASSRILETKLADFGVAGKVVAVRPGPVITTFEFEPAPGVKVSRIVNLADDLAMALRAASVRILAPIPGKPVVGVEVSNPRRETVFIREVLQSDGYKGGESKLTLALGKDTTGNVAVADLGRMPHLLIAGATGTGKSVSMNAMIMSILFKASPRDTRIIMIDPKMLELSTYEGIPHLLVPVVTDPKKAAAALANMVREMEDRYRLLHEKGVRNVDSYNRLIAQIREAAAAEAEDDDEEDEETA